MKGIFNFYFKPSEKAVHALKIAQFCAKQDLSEKHGELTLNKLAMAIEASNSRSIVLQEMSINKRSFSRKNAISGLSFLIGGFLLQIIGIITQLI